MLIYNKIYCYKILCIVSYTSKMGVETKFEKKKKINICCLIMNFILKEFYIKSDTLRDKITKIIFQYCVQAEVKVQAV